jgi:hypothetical protein
MDLAAILAHISSWKKLSFEHVSSLKWPSSSLSFHFFLRNRTKFCTKFAKSHVHIRSHSFTPKFPSKLSTPRFPQSPQGSYDCEPGVHLNQHQNQAPCTPTKASFGFGFIDVHQQVIVTCRPHSWPLADNCFKSSSNTPSPSHHRRT